MAKRRKAFRDVRSIECWSWLWDNEQLQALRDDAGKLPDDCVRGIRGILLRHYFRVPPQIPAGSEPQLDGRNVRPGLERSGVTARALRTIDPATLLVLLQLAPAEGKSRRELRDRTEMSRDHLKRDLKRARRVLEHAEAIAHLVSQMKSLHWSRRENMGLDAVDVVTARARSQIEWAERVLNGDGPMRSLLEADDVRDRICILSAVLKASDSYWTDATIAELIVASDDDWVDVHGRSFKPGELAALASDENDPFNIAKWIETERSRAQEKNDQGFDRNRRRHTAVSRDRRSTK